MTGRIFSSDERKFEPAGFFVLRTPLLPFSSFAASAEDSEGDWFDHVLDEPIVREALFVASPEVAELAANSNRRRQRRVRNTLLKYVTRMSSRCTPFGLFATISLGYISGESDLRIASRDSIQRFARLDMHLLSRVVDTIKARLPVDAHRLKSSPELYAIGGRLRYAETRSGASHSTHHLVEIVPEEYIVEILRFAREWQPVGEIVDFLCKRYDVKNEEAKSFLDELRRNQVLVSDIQLPLTTPDPLRTSLSRIARRASGSPDYAVMRNVSRKLRTLNAKRPGSDLSAYDDVTEELSKLCPFDSKKAFQVDAFRPSEALSLGRSVIDEILRGVDLLRRVGRQPSDGLLDRFVREFTERYGGRAVPLLEALDEEYGIGFGATTPGERLDAPLLDGLRLEDRGNEADVRWDRARVALLCLINRAIASQELEIELTADDVSALTIGSENKDLPDAFAVWASLWSSPQNLSQGNFRVYLRSVTGPSGANFLGRFCHTSSELLALVRHHLRKEQQLAPDAVFAEIIHVPQERVGNVLIRPQLRDYEIVYLGASGAPESRQIAANDLVVNVRKGRVMLTSRRLKRSVLPRLTTAHSFFAEGNLPVYRFLATLQKQAVVTDLMWRWGPFEQLPFLPRVRAGPIVLCPATWRLSRTEISRLASTTSAERMNAIEALSRDKRLPRFVSLVEGDHELVIDLINKSSAEMLIDEIRGQGSATLFEAPAVADMCVTGLDGEYSNEVIIPFTRKQPVTHDAAAWHSSSVELNSAETYTYPPGSEWVYLKLYTGPATADRLLREIVQPEVIRLFGDRSIDKWYFVRYADPEWHVRLRLHCSNANWHAVIHGFNHTLSECIRIGLVRRFDIATYEPEVDRYGGVFGLALCERVFWADSDAVLSLLPYMADPVIRWQATLKGIDDILESARYDSSSKLRFAKQQRLSLGAEFRVGQREKRKFAERYRAERRRAENAIQGILSPKIALVLQQRMNAITSPLQELWQRASENSLTDDYDEILKSLVHMWINRTMRSEHRQHELVLFDLLDRTYGSGYARMTSSVDLPVRST